MKTHNGIAKVATAAVMLLMASCSMPVQVPVQTQQQQQNNQTLIDQLRKLMPSRTQPNSGEQLHPWEEWYASPETLPQVVWPAPGAGDFQPVVIPDRLPSVIWPAPGAGDFETLPPMPVLAQPQWLVGPVLPASTQLAGADMIDRHPAPVPIQLAGADMIDRHPAPVIVQKAGEDLLDRHPAPVIVQKAGEDLIDRHPPVVAPPVNYVAPDNVIAINPAREAAAERALRVIPQAAPRLTRQDVAERSAQRAVDGPNWTPPERETAVEYVIAINPAREAAAERALRVTPQAAPRLTRQDVAERSAQRAVDGPNWTPPERETAFEYVIVINPAREAAAERALRVTPQAAPRLTRQDVAERSAQRAVDGP